MKTRKITLLYITILATLLLGAAFLNMVSAPTEMTAYVWWSPRSHTLDNPVPDPWKAVLFFFSWRVRAGRDIDPSTILLEGMYDPEGEPYSFLWNFMLVVRFDGNDVLTALLLKGGHLSPGRNVIYLEITGQLYDGTPFRGSGRITLTLPENGPP